MILLRSSPLNSSINGIREIKNSNQTEYIIATRQLTDEYWLKLDPDELLIFQDAEKIYKNNAD